MNTQKAAYWFALALFAVALHSEYQRGAFPSLHRAASSAGVTLCRVTTKAERTVALARLIVARPPVTDELAATVDVRQLRNDWKMSEDQREMIREQVRAQAEIVRAQVLQHRGQLELVRSLARQQVRLRQAASRSMVNDCSRTRAAVKIHSGTNLSDTNLAMPDFDMPELEIADSD